MRYKAWGDTPTTFQYTGQRNGDIIGLYFYNARYYDSALGRFIQADTIVPNPSDPQTLNRYSYVLNNPLKFVDPSGHFEVDEIKTYLKNEYGDLWDEYWKSWMQDGAFMKMLYEAEIGYMVLAPTTPFGSGYFTDEGDTFGFENAGGWELRDFQGVGPYRLLDENLTEKLSAETQLSKHFFDSDPGRFSQIWEQPIFIYDDEKGPLYTGLVRRASYRWTNTNVNWRGGDTLPYLAAFVGGTLIGGPLGSVVEGASAATYIHDATTYQYELSVDLFKPRHHEFVTPSWLTPEMMEINERIMETMEY